MRLPVGQVFFPSLMTVGDDELNEDARCGRNGGVAENNQSQRLFFLFKRCGCIAFRE